MTASCFNYFTSLGGLIVLKFWLLSFDDAKLYELVMYELRVIKDLPWEDVSVNAFQSSHFGRALKRLAKKKTPDGKKTEIGKEADNLVRYLAPLFNEKKAKLEELKTQQKALKESEEASVATASVADGGNSVDDHGPSVAPLGGDSSLIGPSLLRGDSDASFLNREDSGFSLDRNASGISLDSGGSLVHEESGMSLDHQISGMSQDLSVVDGKEEEGGEGDQMETTPPPTPTPTPPPTPPRETPTEEPVVAVGAPQEQGVSMPAPPPTKPDDVPVVDKDASISLLPPPLHLPGAPSTTPAEKSPPPITLSRKREGGSAVKFGSGLLKRQKVTDKTSEGGGLKVNTSIDTPASMDTSSTPKGGESAAGGGQRKVLWADQNGKALCAYKFFDSESLTLQDGGDGGGGALHKNKGDWTKKVTDERRREGEKLREQREHQMVEVSLTSREEGVRKLKS